MKKINFIFSILLVALMALNISAQAQEKNIYVKKAGSTLWTSSITDVDEIIFVETAFVPVTNITGVPLGLEATVPLTLIGTVVPSNATNQQITWSIQSAGTTGATITDGNVFLATAAGTVIIRATIVGGLASGNYTRDYTRTVGPAPILVTDVTLNKSTLKLVIGGIERLLATVLPENATNKAVTWESSNKAVASVNGAGEVTALTTGTTTITVTSTDGGKTADCVVTVVAKEDLPGIGEPTLTTDPGILINGIIWATRNVDMPGTFAEKPESWGRFYQWNRKIGWLAGGPVAPTPAESSNGTAWDNSDPTGDYWIRANDPCPVGWRVPTGDELRSLRTTMSTYTMYNWNSTGVNGRTFGTLPNQIFLPYSGWRGFLNNGAFSHQNTDGGYHASTPDPGGNIIRAEAIWMNTGPSNITTGHRRSAINVRCVCETGN